MRILVTKIKYSERTREWNVNINNLAAYKQYVDDPRTDKSIWTFGNFMEFGNTELPEEIEMEVPFDDIFENISEVELYVKSELKNKTSRDIDSFAIIGLTKK